MFHRLHRRRFLETVCASALAACRRRSPPPREGPARLRAGGPVADADGAWLLDADGALLVERA